MKRILKLLLVLLVLTPVLSRPAQAGNTVQAVLTESKTYFNGEEQNLNGFNIAGSNYYSLRDIAKHLSGTASQFNVTWNKQQNAVEIVTGQAYTPEAAAGSIYYSRSKKYIASLSTAKLLVNGQQQQITAYTIGSSNYFQLRDLAGKIPFDVEYNGISNQISVFPKTPDNAYRVKSAFAAKDNGETSDFPRWKSPVTSYLVANQDQTLSVIEADQEVKIETYNDKYELLASQKLAYELPLFGGFYSGGQYNYIAFGQENREENNDKEVIRIVRYDKSFNRIDSVAIKGGASYTIEPFEAGSGRMAEYGDTLVFHTARKRYTTDDGLNHQSQLTIMVNTSTMTVTNDLGRFQKNHVSHSFDQYVLFDGNTQVLVDHGDAYPRSVVLNKGDGNSYQEVDLFAIPGKTGANATGVSIGGFEMSGSSYIVAMNSVDHSAVTEYTSYELVGLENDQRDIILSVLPKTSMSSASVQHITLAKYTGTDRSGSIPKLVKLSDDRMMVLWQEFDKKGNPGSLKYVYVDGNGQAEGAVQTLGHFAVSETYPILSGDKIVWYTNSHGYRMFYSIPLS